MYGGAWMYGEVGDAALHRIGDVTSDNSMRGKCELGEPRLHDIGPTGLI